MVFRAIVRRNGM